MDLYRMEGSKPEDNRKNPLLKSSINVKNGIKRTLFLVSWQNVFSEHHCGETRNEEQGICKQALGERHLAKSPPGNVLPNKS
jgi:hypothetical protein